MRDLNQKTGAVPGQGIAAAGPAVAEVFHHLNALFNNRVRLLALHIDHKADAAGVFFVLRVIKTLLGWISAHKLFGLGSPLTPLKGRLTLWERIISQNQQFGTRTFYRHPLRHYDVGVRQSFSGGAPLSGIHHAFPLARDGASRTWERVRPTEGRAAGEGFVVSSAERRCAACPTPLQCGLTPRPEGVTSHELAPLRHAWLTGPPFRPQPASRSVGQAAHR